MAGRRKKGRKKRKQSANGVFQCIVSVTEACFGRRKRNLQTSVSANDSEDEVEKSYRQGVELAEQKNVQISSCHIQVSDKTSIQKAAHSDVTKSLVREANNIPILVCHAHMENMKGIFTECSHMTWIIPYLAEQDDGASTEFFIDKPASTEVITNGPATAGNEEQIDQECTLFVQSTISVAIKEVEEEGREGTTKRTTEAEVFQICAESVQYLIDAAVGESQKEHLKPECKPFVQSVLDADINETEQEEAERKRKASEAVGICTNLIQSHIDGDVESQEEQYHKEYQTTVHSVLVEAIDETYQDEADKKIKVDEEALEMGKDSPVSATCSLQLPSFFNSQHLEDFELEPLPELILAPELTSSQRLPSFFDAQPNLPSFFSPTPCDNLPSTFCDMSFPSGSTESPEFSAIQTGVSQPVNAVLSLATDLPSLSWEDVEYVTSRQGDATILGTGTYATVYLARQRSCGRLVAVKEFREGIPRQEVLNEARVILTLVGTGFVPELVGVIIPAFDNWSPCIVQDYFGDGKTLEALLYGEGEAIFQKELWFSILHQLSLGIKSFSRHKIIHNDLKPDNILVDVSDRKNVKVKVIDFGLATKGRGYIFRGTQEKFARCPHMAPEAKQGRFTTVASDVYSLGYIFNEMAKSAPSILPIASRCMAENPDDRPNPDDIISAVQVFS